MNQQIRIENKKVYLDKWVIGSIGKTFTGRCFFAADENYCSPLEAKDLRDIANELDRMNEAQLPARLELDRAPQMGLF